MSLEQAAWKEHGPAAPSDRPPTTGDRVARAVAFVILIALVAGSVWIVSLVTFGPHVLISLLVLAYVHVFFRQRELQRRVAEQARTIAELRGAGGSLLGSPKPPTGDDAPHDEEHRERQ